MPLQPPSLQLQSTILLARLLFCQDIVAIIIILYKKGNVKLQLLLILLYYCYYKTQINVEIL